MASTKSPRPFFLGLIFVFALGFLGWPVTRPAQWAAERLVGRSGWQVSIAQARWTPWRSLELRDVKLQTPHGGRLHLVRVWIAQQAGPLPLGRWTTAWRLGEIRLDPTSWRIRKPAAQEVLSAEPVARSGTAVLEVRPAQVDLTGLSLQGRLLRLSGEGWMGRHHQAQLHLEGALSERVLRAMSLLKVSADPPEPWKSFRLELQVAPEETLLSFVSDFFSNTLKIRKGRRS